jgi:hypothetical protein
MIMTLGFDQWLQALFAPASLRARSQGPARLDLDRLSQRDLADLNLPPEARLRQAARLADEHRRKLWP